MTTPHAANTPARSKRRTCRARRNPIHRQGPLLSPFGESELTGASQKPTFSASFSSGTSRASSRLASSTSRPSHITRELVASSATTERSSDCLRTSVICAYVDLLHFPKISVSHMGVLQESVSSVRSSFRTADQANGPNQPSRAKNRIFSRSSQTRTCRRFQRHTRDYANSLPDNDE